MLASLERKADVASLSQQQTTCSCYRVRNDYCCYQYMCKCSPMCWNGYQPKCAPATEHAPPPPGQPPVLTPVSCSQQQTFRNALSETFGGGLGVRSAGGAGGGRGDGGEGGDGRGEAGGGGGGEGWLGSRSGVDWRFGQTMLQTLIQSETNIAHFSGPSAENLSHAAPGHQLHSARCTAIPRLASCLEGSREGPHSVARLTLSLASPCRSPHPVARLTLSLSPIFLAENVLTLLLANNFTADLGSTRNPPPPSSSQPPFPSPPISLPRREGSHAPPGQQLHSTRCTAVPCDSLHALRDACPPLTLSLCAPCPVPPLPLPPEKVLTLLLANNFTAPAALQSTVTHSGTCYPTFPLSFPPLAYNTQPPHAPGQQLHSRFWFDSKPPSLVFLPTSLLPILTNFPLQRRSSRSSWPTTSQHPLHCNPP
ncbi:unnamed protein product [Closterium sp. Naga37s-1]|nr:unnamed protein product [Closterium sp. Naga37s-1]